MKTVHQQIKEAGVEYVGYYSDLYVQATQTASEIIRDYEYKENVKVFRNALTGQSWFDIPFANDDYYKNLEARKKRL